MALLQDGGSASGVTNVKNAGVQPATTDNAAVFVLRPDNQVPTYVATATIARPSVSNSSFSVWASNANRKGGIIYNDSTTSVYVKFGATAAATSFTYKLAPGQTLELTNMVYNGAVDAIGVAATGNLQTTELS